ncbi:MAG: hypothetical protein ACRDYC_03660, partial [Acidimicrobiales bacterium]
MEWPAIAVGVCVLLPLLHDALDPGGGDLGAWCVKALVAGALSWVGLIAIASGWNPLRRLSTPAAGELPSIGEGTTAGQAARAEI